MDKIREILENLCDEDDENVRCTMIDLAFAEIKKVWVEMVGENEELKLNSSTEEMIRMGRNQLRAELRQKLTYPPNESEVRR